MYARTICMTIGLVMAGTAWGQVEVDWERAFDNGPNDLCFSLDQTTDGGYVIAGRSSNNNGSGVWLVRTNEDGDSLWSRSFPGTWCNSIIQTADEGFALTGGAADTVGGVNINFWLMKTDANGDSLWSSTYGGRSYDQSTSIVQTPDGGFAMLGITATIGQEYRDFLLVRTDANGDIRWSRTYSGGRGVSTASSLTITADGVFAIGLTVLPDSAVYRFCLLKTDADGDSLWSRTYDTDGTQGMLSSLIQTTDDGFALAGTDAPFDDDDPDFCLVRTDADGRVLWSNSYGLERDFCKAIIQTDDRGFLLAGSTFGGDANTAFWIVRTNADGDSLWSQTFGGAQSQSWPDLIQASDGSYVMAGTINSAENNNDFYLVKTTPDPASVSSSLIPYPSSLLLEPPFPNPFNSTTRISFSSGSAAQPTRLAIFDPLGRRVAELIPGSGDLSRRYPVGTHSVVWDAKEFPAGGYVVRLEAGAERVERTIILEK